MTMPWMMNCNHSDEGWCLPCVSKMGIQLDDAVQLLIRCYQAGHREGWQNGETNTEVFNAVNDFMTNRVGADDWIEIQQNKKAR